jgi:hypothetical protein
LHEAAVQAQAHQPGIGECSARLNWGFKKRTEDGLGFRV